MSKLTDNLLKIMIIYILIDKNVTFLYQCFKKQQAFFYSSFFRFRLNFIKLIYY